MISSVRLAVAVLVVATAVAGTQEGEVQEKDAKISYLRAALEEKDAMLKAKDVGRGSVADDTRETNTPLLGEKSDLSVKFMTERQTDMKGQMMRKTNSEEAASDELGSAQTEAEAASSGNCKWGSLFQKGEPCKRFCRSKVTNMEKVPGGWEQVCGGASFKGWKNCLGCEECKPFCKQSPAPTLAPNKAEKDKAEKDKAEKEKAEKEKAEKDKAEKEKAEKEKAEQDKAKEVEETKAAAAKKTKEAKAAAAKKEESTQANETPKTSTNKTKANGGPPFHAMVQDKSTQDASRAVVPLNSKAFKLYVDDRCKTGGQRDSRDGFRGVHKPGNKCAAGRDCWREPDAWVKWNGKDLFNTQHQYPEGSFQKDGVAATVIMGGVVPGALPVPYTFRVGSYHHNGRSGWAKTCGLKMEIGAEDLTENFVASELHLGASSDGIVCKASKDMMVLVEYQEYKATQKAKRSRNLGDDAGDSMQRGGGSAPTPAPQPWIPFPATNGGSPDFRCPFQHDTKACILKFHRPLHAVKLRLWLWCSENTTSTKCEFDPERRYSDGSERNERSCHHGGSTTRDGVGLRCPSGCPGLNLEGKSRNVILRASIVTPLTKFVWTSGVLSAVTGALDKKQLEMSKNERRMDWKQCAALLNDTSVKSSFGGWSTEAHQFFQEPPTHKDPKSFTSDIGDWNVVVSKKWMAVAKEGKFTKHMLCYAAKSQAAKDFVRGTLTQENKEHCCVSKFAQLIDDITDQDKKNSRARLKNF